MKEYESPSLPTQAERGEQLVALLPAIDKGSNIIGVAINELYTGKIILKDKIGENDENWWQ